VTREYPARPLVGIGAVVLRRDSVLLVRRGKPPSAGSWSIPGGAQKLGETAEAAARRELREETGLDVGPLHLLTHVDSIHRDAAGRVQYHYTILDFAAEWVSGEPTAGGDVTEAGFFAFDALEPLQLWSEAHRVIGLARARFGLA
jgi:ADP-ribose pyrophosphatase YjhB (NUDIX family)